MIDVSTEHTFPLSRPPNWLVGRTGRPVSRTTLERWAKVGVRGGIKLETCLLGYTRVSSLEAVNRFMAFLNGGSPAEDHTLAPTPRPNRTLRQRRKASEEAAQKLQRGGY